MAFSVLDSGSALLKHRHLQLKLVKCVSAHCRNHTDLARNTAFEHALLCFGASLLDQASHYPWNVYLALQLNTERKRQKGNLLNGPGANTRLHVLERFLLMSE